MAENYKHLYQQTKQMLAVYQDELVPGFRKKIEELEKNQIPVRCKECEHFDERYRNVVEETGKVYCGGYCYHWDYEQGMSPNEVDGDDFCSYGERRTESD